LKSKIAFKHPLVNSNKEHSELQLVGSLWDRYSISKLAIPTYALADINGSQGGGKFVATGGASKK
jgi:hypothetical protein